MIIGYACIPLTIKNKTTRSLAFKNFNEKLLIKLIEENLIKIRDYIYKITRKYSDLIDSKVYNSYYYYY